MELEHKENGASPPRKENGASPPRVADADSNQQWQQQEGEGYDDNENNDGDAVINNDGDAVIISSKKLQGSDSLIYEKIKAFLFLKGADGKYLFDIDDIEEGNSNLAIKNNFPEIKEVEDDEVYVKISRKIMAVIGSNSNHLLTTSKL